MNKRLPLDELSSPEDNIVLRPTNKAKAGTEFALAVRHALKNYHRPDRLDENQLLSSRVVLARLEAEAPPSTPIQALQEVLRTHCDRLAETPNVAALARVLDLTYFRPMRCRKAAAESLHLSWSTYRRRVANAVQLLAAQIWQTELALACAAAEAPAAPPNSPAPIGPEAPLTPPVVPPQKRRFRRVVALLVLAVMCIALWLLLPLGPGPDAASLDSSEHANKPTLAVLPFLNINQDRAARYLSDGIAVDLTDRFERLGKLRVAARTSSFAFRGRAGNARKIGQTLGVGNILEGSIQNTTSGLRIRVALVNTSDGYERWSREYIVRARNLPKIEDLIVTAVAEKLHLKPSKPLAAGPLVQSTRNP
jgi:TolB-like protein